MVGIQGRSPNEQAPIFRNDRAVPPSDDILHNHVLQAVDFEWNVGGKLVALAQVTRRVVTDRVY